MKKHFTIALDGPGGAGKSSLAKAVAKDLNILHVDTGAIYRTIGYAAFSRGLDAKDASQIAPLLKDIHIEMSFDENGGQQMLLDGKDVSREIRLPEISEQTLGALIKRMICCISHGFVIAFCKLRYIRHDRIGKLA